MISDTDYPDIQGLIISGYGHLFESLYLFIAFDDPPKAKAWLKTVVANVTTADWRANGKAQKPEFGLNIAFTNHGLAALSYPQGALTQFSAEFISGMADPERSRRLGDFAEGDPQQWEFGGPKQLPIDALLILQAATPERLEQLGNQYRSGVRLAAPPQRGSITKHNKEHFGFADGISQPEIAGSPRLKEDPQPGVDIVPAGEFILGYPNAYGMFPASPLIPATDDPQDRLSVHSSSSGGEKDFGKNGTYLVFRKLEQDVAGFRKFVRENASPGLSKERLAAKIVGRWPSGAPLVLSPDRDPNPPKATNFFGYHATDADGLACPIGAHIRRANPRDDLEHNPEESIKTVERHRILRRGASYGPRLDENDERDDGKKRGLNFICLNSDIRRQFEFVQQTWLNYPKFSGLSDDRDPLMGPGSRFMTIQEAPVRRRLANVPRFVTMRGGAYFFLPGMRALDYLTTL